MAAVVMPPNATNRKAQIQAVTGALKQDRQAETKGVYELRWSESKYEHITERPKAAHPLTRTLCSSKPFSKMLIYHNTTRDSVKRQSRWFRLQCKWVRPQGPRKTLSGFKLPKNYDRAATSAA